LISTRGSLRLSATPVPRQGNLGHGPSMCRGVQPHGAVTKCNAEQRTVVTCAQPQSKGQSSPVRNRTAKEGRHVANLSELTAHLCVCPSSMSDPYSTELDGMLQSTALALSAQPASLPCGAQLRKDHIEQSTGHIMLVGCKRAMSLTHRISHLLLNLCLRHRNDARHPRRLSLLAHQMI